MVWGTTIDNDGDWNHVQTEHANTHTHTHARKIVIPTCWGAYTRIYIPRDIHTLMLLIKFLTSISKQSQAAEIAGHVMHITIQGPRTHKTPTSNTFAPHGWGPRCWCIRCKLCWWQVSRCANLPIHLPVACPVASGVWCIQSLLKSLSCTDAQWPIQSAFPCFLAVLACRTF